MRKLSTGPLESMLEQYDAAQFAVKHAQIELQQKKLQLVQFAVDENYLDCLTVNVDKLKRAV